MSLITVLKIALKVLKAAFRTCFGLICHRKNDLMGITGSKSKPLPLISPQNNTFTALSLSLSSRGLERGVKAVLPSPRQERPSGAFADVLAAILDALSFREEMLLPTQISVSTGVVMPD